jgi:hypothetical protein
VSESLALSPVGLVPSADRIRRDTFRGGEQTTMTFTTCFDPRIPNRAARSHDVAGLLAVMRVSG